MLDWVLLHSIFFVESWAVIFQFIAGWRFLDGGALALLRPVLACTPAWRQGAPHVGVRRNLAADAGAQHVEKGA
jgi:hypothetical protein